MQNFYKLSKSQLISLKKELLIKYNSFLLKNLTLDISRGKPSKQQLDLSNKMLNNKINFEKAKQDIRNYGILDGIKETKQLFSSLLEIPESQIIIGGNSSLNLLYDCVTMLYIWGYNNNKPWKDLKTVKILCPVPGYDRHFAIFEKFGFKLVPIEMKNNNLDISLIENLVMKDENIKGIICVPLFSNPTGLCYSKEIVIRLSKMKTKAKDFKIFWDNAYGIHYIYKKVKLLNILEISKKYNTEDRILYFFSTSKINFAGSGISILASSLKSIEEIKKHLSVQTIGYDKINQFRIFEFFKTKENIYIHMDKMACILKPKFDLVLNKLEQEFKGSEILTWTKPYGGYFVSITTLDNCAKKIVKMCKKAGLILTEAGSTYPYGKNNKDNNIRIAPSFPELKELAYAIEIFCICVKIISIEKILKEDYYG